MKRKNSNKVIMIILVIIILGLVGYIVYDKVLFKNVEEKEDKVVEKNTDDSNTRNTVSDIYSSIINQYQNAINDKDLKDDNDVDNKYSNLNVGYIGDYHFRNNLNGMFYYSYYDIDKNGVEELIISYGYEASEGEVYYYLADVYAIHDNAPVKLEEVSKVYYRVNLIIYDNGVMRVHGSGSAVTGGEDFYKIASDGYSEEKIGSYSYEYKDEENVIITDELTKEVTNYSDIDEIEWIKNGKLVSNDEFNWKKIDV